VAAAIPVLRDLIASLQDHGGPQHAGRHL
jgi:hypothetical protein